MKKFVFLLLSLLSLNSYAVATGNVADKVENLTFEIQAVTKYGPWIGPYACQMSEAQATEQAEQFCALTKFKKAELVEKLITDCKFAIPTIHDNFRGKFRCVADTP
jgi:hypothetical protein